MTETIADAKLTRIEQDLSRARQRDTHDGPRLERFEYNHGDLLWHDDKGRSNILFLHGGDDMKYRAARALWQLAPKVVQELIWGYRLAKKAGLLDLPRSEKTLRDLQPADPAAHFAKANDITSGVTEFPYDRTFKAIAAATTCGGDKDVNVSVAKFQEAFRKWKPRAAIRG